jgi:hypothetical protein
MEGENLESEYEDIFVGLLQNHVLPIAEKINFLNSLASEWVSFRNFFEESFIDE